MYGEWPRELSLQLPFECVNIRRIRNAGISVFVGPQFLSVTHKRIRYIARDNHLPG